ncbi:hypothetical protein D3C73_1511000 [compost metagenome]
MLPIAFIANPATKILFGKLSLGSGVSVIVVSLWPSVLHELYGKEGWWLNRGVGVEELKVLWKISYIILVILSLKRNRETFLMITLLERESYLPIY